MGVKVFEREFFATRHDQLPRLQALESEVALQFVRTGMFKRPEPVVFNSVSEIPDLGLAPEGDYTHTPKYLVVAAGTRIRIKEEPQESGGVLYAVDLRKNLTAFVFRPAGQFDEKTLIPGLVGTATGSKTSLALCKRFWRALGGDYVKVQRYYVGPEAYEFLKQGGRLTPAVQCPPYMDTRL